MSGPRSELILLLVAAACGGQPDEPLSAVQEGLAAEAALVAGAGVTGTLLVAAVASEACATQDGLWADTEVGDVAPLSEPLLSALGTPAVAGVERLDAHTVSLALEGVSLLGWSDANLLLNAEGDGEAMELSATVAREGEQLGEATVSVLQGCADVPRASGEASWTDADERRHVVSFPVDEGDNMQLDELVPWIPSEGALAWSGSVREVSVQIETEDAGQITLDERGSLPVGSWPARVTRQEEIWSAVIPIAP